MLKQCADTRGVVLRQNLRGRRRRSAGRCGFVTGRGVDGRVEYFIPPEGFIVGRGIGVLAAVLGFQEGG
jgi:hypothetical protein